MEISSFLSHSHGDRTTPLAASQRISDVTGAVNRGFLEDRDNFSFFLGGIGSLSSHPSGRKLGSR